MPVPPFELVFVPLALVAAEATSCAAFRLPRYDLRDTAANLAMGVGGLVAGVPGRAAALWLSYALYEHRLFDLPSTPWTWALLLVAEDLCFYCFHRVSHTVPLFWAAHAPHHSSEHYNFSTALRTSWTTPFTGIAFWLPLPLLGFHPVWIVVAHGISLAFQFLLHTQAVGSLGWLDWILNTPSHHRVHHAKDPEYLDRNFGGIFIVWDRLWGTFAAEGRAPTYGTVTPVRSHHPLVIAFGPWVALVRKVAASELGWRGRVACIVGGHGAAGGAARSQASNVSYQRQSAPPLACSRAAS